MLALVVVGITRVIVNPARASKDSNSRAVRSAPPVNVIIIMSALPKPGGVALAQHQFDDEQSARGGHRGATVTEDSETVVFTPVVDDVREDVGVRPRRHGLERAARLNRHTVLDP